MYGERLGLKLSVRPIAKAFIRLGGCPGLSGSLLGKHGIVLGFDNVE